MITTTQLSDPVSLVLSELLQQLSLGIIYNYQDLQGQTAVDTFWPIARDGFPDQPDILIAINQTEGTKDGRLSEGETVKHQGFQILVRSNNQDFGILKCDDIFHKLSSQVNRTEVTVGANKYLVQAITITSGPIPIGKEIENSKRHLFSVNGTVTISLKGE